LRGSNTTLKDLETFFDMVRAKHGENMVFLVGHSMGGTIATAYVPDHQHELAGLVLSGPGLKVPPKVSPLLIALAPIGSLLLPKMGVHSLDPATVSRDKAVVDALLNDPLCYHGRISARLGAGLIKAYKQLRSQMAKITLPILIMHGTADWLSDPEGSQILYEQLVQKTRR